MTFRHIQSHNPNNILLKDIQNQLIEIHLKMNTTSVIVFIIVYLCICIIMFSAFIIVELILYPIENEIKQKQHKKEEHQTDKQKEEISDYADYADYDKNNKDNDYEKTMVDKKIN